MIRKFYATPEQLELIYQRHLVRPWWGIWRPFMDGWWDSDGHWCFRLWTWRGGEFFFYYWEGGDSIYICEFERGYCRYIVPGGEDREWPDKIKNELKAYARTWIEKFNRGNHI